MKRVRISLTAVSLLAIVSSYAGACYYAGYCICAVSGSCYSRTVLPDCQMPTCIIADSSASSFNVCSGNGPYTGRETIVEFPTTCCPAACRIYDNCAHQYVSLTGTSCCFSIAQYQGAGSGCNQ
jgi:hypothetical protein